VETPQAYFILNPVPLHADAAATSIQRVAVAPWPKHLDDRALDLCLFPASYVQLRSQLLEETRMQLEEALRPVLFRSVLFPFTCWRVETSSMKFGMHACPHRTPSKSCGRQSREMRSIQA